MPVDGWDLTGRRAYGQRSGGAPQGAGSGTAGSGQQRLPWETPEAVERATARRRAPKRAAAAPAEPAGVDSATAQVAPDAITVSQALERASSALSAIPTLTVLGEVSGFRGPNARSGHCYFQIKDESAAVDCIVWRGSYQKRAFDLRDGLQALFTGQFNLYKPTGRMSFVARSFTLAGEGLLRQQVAELAEKLRREGLMDEARKRHIPVFCTRIAVVTSLSGAVIDDVKRTLARRNPLVEIICVGAKVQGEGAPEELIQALDRAARLRPDCILLVRGGGSFEDLMTFNDENLARAVAACPVPVVTGIGHEPDTSICDMVSDRRASTPTAAAESVAPAIQELVDVLEQREQRLTRSLATLSERVNAAIDVQRERLGRAMGSNLERKRIELRAAAERPCLMDPTSIVDHRRMELVQTEERLSRLLASRSGFAGKRHDLALATARLRNEGEQLLAAPGADLARAAASLDALSPLKVLGRGYAIAYGEDGVRTKASSFAPNERMTVRLSDGTVTAQVESVDVSLKSPPAT